MRPRFLARLTFLLLPAVAPINAQSPSGTPPDGLHRFAGTWSGRLSFERPLSYDGNDAKGEHLVSSQDWVIIISADEKTATFRPAYWKGPPSSAPIVRKGDRALSWTESGLPKEIYDKNGRLLGTSSQPIADYDSVWSMQLTSSNTAVLTCESNAEDMYNLVTDTNTAGVLHLGAPYQVLNRLLTISLIVFVSVMLMNLFLWSRTERWAVVWRRVGFGLVWFFVGAQAAIRLVDDPNGDHMYINFALLIFILAIGAFSFARVKTLTGINKPPVQTATETTSA
jgi:hypothetical protein